jgi:small subunit ribosomal protein S7
MPRRREVPKREILPDPKFGNVEVAKFMNVLMLDGKNPSLSELFMALLSILRKKLIKSP